MKMITTIVWGMLMVLFLSAFGACTVRAYSHSPRHRVWVPGHWSPGYHGYKHWVRGHYEYR